LLATRGTIRCKKLLGPYHLLEMELDSPLERASAGQFALLEAPGCLLMRPLSLFSFGRGYVSFLLRIAGRGTAAIVSSPCGSQLRMVLPLGRGFPPPGEGDEVVLVAGGVGIAPLFPWAMALSKRGCRVHLLWGAKDSSWFPPPLIVPLRAAGVEISLATEDGSIGKRGMVTDLLGGLTFGKPTVAYLCGPMAMVRRALEILKDKNIRTFTSLEERMACGVGACFGCAVKTRSGYKLVCRDGPVFRGEELHGAGT